VTKLAAQYAPLHAGFAMSAILLPEAPVIGLA